MPSGCSSSRCRVAVADDAADALTRPAAERGVGFEAGAADAVVRASHGYPYFLQEWGYHLWNAADGPRITAELLEAVRPRVVRHLDEHCFLVRFDRLTRKEQDYLRAMAAHGDTAFTAPMFDAFLLRRG